MMPVLLTTPRVGLMPTTPLTLDGQTIEPLVSVPTATLVRLAATATAEPLDDPQGLPVEKLEPGLYVHECLDEVGPDSL